MTRKQLYIILLIAFFVGAMGSIVFERGIFPALSNIPGLSFLNKLSSNAPIIITRREEVYFNEGANLIELTKQAQNFIVSIYSSAPEPKLLGNGIVLTSDGLIFTSREVVTNLNELQVVLNDGRNFQGQVRALDPKSELAVVTIQVQGLSVASFADANGLTIAQRILALGITNQVFTRKFASGLVTKTLGNDINPGQTFSSDAFNLSLGTEAVLTSDFTGGPVINLEGRLVGLVANSNGKILVSEIIQSALNAYLQQGKIQRPFYGFRFQNITKALSGLKKIDVGALVVDVENSSAAQQAGLQKSDLILEVDGQTLEDSSLEVLLLKNTKPEFTLTVKRSGSDLELKLKPIVK